MFQWRPSLFGYLFDNYEHQLWSSSNDIKLALGISVQNGLVEKSLVILSISKLYSKSVALQGNTILFKHLMLVSSVTPDIITVLETLQSVTDRVAC